MLPPVPEKMRRITDGADLNKLHSYDVSSLNAKRESNKAGKIEDKNNKSRQVLKFTVSGLEACSQILNYPKLAQNV